MNACSEDIKDMLVADSSLGLTFTENLFIARMPASPVNCVVIYDAPGYPDALGLKDQGYEYPSIQIRVRNRTYLTGMELAQKIKTSLHGRSAQIWNETLYTVIHAVGGPALLNWDENSNSDIVINFNLQRR